MISTFGGWPLRRRAADAAVEVVLAERVGRERELRRAGVELRVRAVGDGELERQPEGALVEARGRVGRVDVDDHPAEPELERQACARALRSRLYSHHGRGGPPSA